ncbi:hypothetical protein BUALT_BualtUnG0052500 [Buddleja alternifolia]|uniref:CCHC-type domain-containing protein n=1 Tax=Buddleja alternifolia TaxID=168488 RepID=A0AAV6W6P5_9LAMI|nr:hypothetical protein BUALT_BualtUnG0052500 [Buddleja alternifolia]
MNENLDFNALIASTNRMNVEDYETIPQVNFEAINAYTLVAKVFSDKSFNDGAVKNTLLKAWNAKKKVVVNILDNNKLVFVFEDKSDFNKVLSLAPWSFKGNLVVLNQWLPEKIISDITLEHAPFWIQASNIPVKYITPTTAKAIGNLVGSFIKADLSSESHRWKSFLRIRVTIDLNYPLKDLVVIHPSPGVNISVEIRYERLGDFCYKCGRLGHKWNSCQLESPPRIGAAEGVDGPLAFGTWLRAESTFSHRPTAIPPPSLPPSVKTTVPMPSTSHNHFPDNTPHLVSKLTDITPTHLIDQSHLFTEKAPSSICQFQKPKLNLSSFPIDTIKAKDMISETSDCLPTALNGLDVDVAQKTNPKDVSPDSASDRMLSVPINQQAQSSTPHSHSCLHGPALLGPFSSFVHNPISPILVESNKLDQPCFFVNKPTSIIPIQRTPCKPGFKFSPISHNYKRPASSPLPTDPIKKMKSFSLIQNLEIPSPFDQLTQLTHFQFPPAEGHFIQPPAFNQSSGFSSPVEDILHSVSLLPPSDSLPEPKIISEQTIIISERKITKWKRLARSQNRCIQIEDVSSSSVVSSRKSSPNSIAGPKGSME